MTKWIKCSERLPEEDQRCWISTKDKGVMDGKFEKDATTYSFEIDTAENRFRCEDGFRLDSEYIFYAYLDRATHWQPYYTPEPPNE